MTSAEIAEKVIATVRQTPAVAQELIADVAKLDLTRLASVASACNIDISKLDMAAVTAKLLDGGLFGGLFGR